VASLLLVLTPTKLKKLQYFVFASTVGSTFASTFYVKNEVFEGYLIPKYDTKSLFSALTRVLNTLKNTDRGVLNTIK